MLNNKKFINISSAHFDKKNLSPLLFPLVVSTENFQGFADNIKEIPFINSFNKPDFFKAQAKYSKIHLDSLLFSPYIRKTAVNRLNMVHRSLRLFFLSLLRLETTVSFVRFIRGGAIVASNGFLSFVPQSSIKQKLKKVFSNYKVIKGKKRNCALSTSFKYNIILTDLKVKRAKKRDSLVRRKKSRFKKKSL